MAAGDDTLVRPNEHLPGAAFALSAQKIWEAIRTQKDLNLPAHKVGDRVCTYIPSVREVCMQLLAGFSYRLGRSELLHRATSAACCFQMLLKCKWSSSISVVHAQIAFELCIFSNNNPNRCSLGPGFGASMTCHSACLIQPCDAFPTWLYCVFHTTGDGSQHTVCRDRIRPAVSLYHGPGGWTGTQVAGCHCNVHCFPLCMHTGSPLFLRIAHGSWSLGDAQ